MAAPQAGGPGDLHLGDEAMLEANLAALRAWYGDDVHFVTSSRDPDWTRRRYSVQAVSAPPAGDTLPGLDWDRDPDVRKATRWLLAEPVVDALRSCDGLIVSGGGNLCSTWPAKLLERAVLLHCAADLGKPAVVVGQTLGPLLTPRQSALLASALARADLVGVRDGTSLDLARALGLGAGDVRLQLDDAFFLEPLPVEDRRAGLAASGRRWILVSLDPSLAAGSETRLDGLAAQLDALAEAMDSDLVFVPHVSGSEAEARREDDVTVGGRLAALLEKPLRRLEPWAPREVRWLTARAALVVSTRYHGLVFATASGVPALGVYSDRYTRAKLKGALAHAGLEGWAIGLESAARGDLLTAGLELWHRRGDVRRALAALRETAASLEQPRWERIARALGLPSGRISVASLAGRLPSIAVDAEPAVTVERPASPRGPSEEQWRRYDEQGYMRLGRILTDGEVDALRRRYEAIVSGETRLPSLQTQLDTGGAYEDLPEPVAGAPEPGRAVRKVQGLEGDPLFLALLRHDIFRRVCERHYGPHASVSIFRAMVMNKPAGQGTYLPWHQDGGDVWKLDRDPLVTIWVALDRATREKGCLQVIPGSHRLGLLTRNGSTLSAEHACLHCPEEAVVSLEVEAGEALVLHNWLIHRSGVNETDAPRRAFTACYMDARTLGTLTGDRFPTVFGPHEEGEEALPFVFALREEMRLLRETAEESVRYARSLEDETAKLRAMREEAERYAWSLEAALGRAREPGGASRDTDTVRNGGTEQQRPADSPPPPHRIRGDDLTRA